MGPSLAAPERDGVPVTSPEYRRGRAPANKGKKYPPQPLTEAEVFALLAACSPRSATGLRHRALIVLLWRGGLRIAEALALFPADVNLDVGAIDVRHGKGDRQRIVGIDPESAAVVGRWMDRRERLGISARKPLICRIRKPKVGGPLNTAQVRETLPILAARAGIVKRVHPHGLRHTHAFELAMEGAPLKLIQKQLGHKRLDTTDHYLDHLAPAQLIAHMQTRAWPVNDHVEAPAMAAAAARSS